LNLVAAAPLWLLTVLACAMLGAAAEDAVRLRISNVTSLIVLATAIAAALIAGPSWALWQNGVVFLAILVLGTVAFSSGLLGGGDVKLFAAAGLWFDLRSALWFVALVFLAGGVVAIAYMLTRPFRRRSAGKKGTRVPYGIAIALGMLAVAVLDRGSASRHERQLQQIRMMPSRS
jgi:prepilin peptidase CpaA